MQGKEMREETLITIKLEMTIEIGGEMKGNIVVAIEDIDIVIDLDMMHLTITVKTKGNRQYEQNKYHTD